MVNHLITDNIEWYNTINQEIDCDVLLSIGNHDSWIKEWELAPAVDVYDKYIAPIAAKYDNIVQPDNAAEQGLNYYYKDYNNVRVIVLDIPYWNDAEYQWLRETLEGTPQNYHVICMTHYPYERSLCKWRYDSFAEFMSRETNPFFSHDSTDNPDTYDYLHLPVEACLAVADYKNNGGNFICWLAGHTHYDYVLQLVDVERFGIQHMVVISSANGELGLGDSVKIADTKTYDVANIIGIDTDRHIIKSYRYGLQKDDLMREKEYLVIDYSQNIIRHS
jgi:hypothetical protein